MIDFVSINADALARCPGLLESILPGGVIEGNEYVCANIDGGSGKSCKVNMKTGVWCDFASDDKGGDLISLVAAQNGIDQGEAARRLVELMGGNSGSGKAAPAKSGQPKVIMPVPERAPVPDFRHGRYGKPAAVYQYRGPDGATLGYVCRFNTGGTDSHGKPEKEFAPLVFTEKGWRWQGFTKPYPFFGLEKLASLSSDGAILLVEGEGKAGAAQAVLRQIWAVMGYGGATRAQGMDVEPLRGKTVYIWPDNDKPGFIAAMRLAEKCRGVADCVKIIEPPINVLESWDIANAIDEGWSAGQIKGWITAHRHDPEEFERLARKVFPELAEKADREAQNMPDGAGATPNREKPLIALNIADFLKLEIPERKPLLAPIIMEKGHAMIYASRGTGKTYVALSIAWAVASGGSLFDRWHAPEPRRVLLVDGEMPAWSLKERLERIRASEPDINEPDNLYILSADTQESGIPNLATQEGQRALEPFIEKAELIILDNLATLAAYGKSNEAESWLPMQLWLLELRRRGKTALLIHHANKSGDQRGTGAKEDIIDTSISLELPRDYSPEDGARFEVHYAKHRNFTGRDAMPFEVRLTAGADGVTRWHTRTLENMELEKLRELRDQGYSIRDCAEEMGITASKAQRLNNKLKPGGF